MPSGASKVSYSNAVKGPNNSRLGCAALDFIEPKIIDGKCKGALSVEVIEKAEKECRNCLLIYVVGPRPFFKAMKVRRGNENVGEFQHRI